MLKIINIPRIWMKLSEKRNVSLGVWNVSSSIEDYLCLFYYINYFYLSTSFIWFNYVTGVWCSKILRDFVLYKGAYIKLSIVNAPTILWEHVTWLNSFKSTNSFSHQSSFLNKSVIYISKKINYITFGLGGLVIEVKQSGRIFNERVRCVWNKIKRS